MPSIYIVMNVNYFSLKMGKKRLLKCVNHYYESWHFLHPLSVWDNDDKVAWVDLPAGKHGLLVGEMLRSGPHLPGDSSWAESEGWGGLRSWRKRRNDDQGNGTAWTKAQPWPKWVTAQEKFWIVRPPCALLWELVQFSCSVMSDSVTPWTAARQAFLSITNCWGLPKPMSIELVMPSNHLILCHPLLLIPSIFPSIRVFANDSALRIRWPKYWSFASTSDLPMNTQDWSPLGWTGWISLQSKGLSRVFSNTTLQKHQFFSTQLSL